MEKIKQIVIIWGKRKERKKGGREERRKDGRKEIWKAGKSYDSQKSK